MATTKTQRQRERTHVKMRTIETELRNVLSGINQDVGHVERAVKSRDCQTARLNFDQVAIAFRRIGPKLARLETLYRALRIPPGSLVEHQVNDEVRISVTPTPKRHAKKAAPATKRPRPRRAAAR